MKYIRLLLLTCTALLGFPAVIPAQKQILQLGDRREIFIDSYLIQDLKNVTLKLHNPEYKGKVMDFDLPWEGQFSLYTTILRDGSLYRMYYRGRSAINADNSMAEVTCYAESFDGIHWRKPNLGFYKIDGSSENNILLAEAAPVTHNFCPFIDDNPNRTLRHRYKAIGGSGKSGLIVYVSEDGLHWEKLRDEPIITKGAFDSQNLAFWSASEGVYVCYFRTSNKGIRSVSRATSKDFLTWTEPVAMEFGDTPLEHLYTQQTSPYFRAPHIYIATAARFMPKRQVLTDEQAQAIGVNPSYFGDCSDAVLLSTRGGSHYDRTFMESFIRPRSGLENWVSRTNYPALNVVQTGPEEMSVYVNEHYAQPTAQLARYAFRIDGFSSLNAGYAGGEVVTKPFTFSGKEMEINFNTSAAGEIRFELQDDKGKPYPGFTAEDCQVLIGNQTDRIVEWKGKTDVSALAGKPVRLRILMKDADLYAFKFN